MKNLIPIASLFFLLVIVIIFPIPNASSVAVIPLLAVAGISALAQGIGKAVFSNQADTQKNRESDRLDKEYSLMSKKLGRGYADLKNTQLGQTSIDPEAQLALNENEKASSNAISRSTRAATNSNEATTSIASITNNRVRQAFRISAAEGARRRIAAENAAKTGLASEQAQVQLDQQKQAAKRGAYQDINMYTAQSQDFFAGMANDFAQAALYQKAFGGNVAAGNATE